MSLQLKLLDHFTLSSSLGLNFACSYSEDDRFFILNDEGIYILALTGSVSNELPKFSCTKYYIRVSDYSPCVHIEIDINSFHNELSKEDVFELTMKTEYSANLRCTKPMEPAPIFAEWSPKCRESNCFLAVLTNLYSLEVYTRILNETDEKTYKMVLNVSSAIIDHAKQNWSDPTRFGILRKLDEFKKRINNVTPTAFTWSHSFEIVNASVFVLFCGHLNGDVSVWRLHPKYSQLNDPILPVFLGRHCTQMQRITTMFWHKSSDYGGGLFVSDLDGKINLIHITKLNEPEANFKLHQFFTEPDKIKVDKISVLTYNTNTFILVVKQRVLIIYGINESGELFDYVSEYIPEYYITGLHHFDNKILVLTLPGLLTELVINVEDNKIIIEKSLIPLKYDMMKYRTHGFVFSKNKVFCCIVAFPWNLRTGKKTFIDVLVFHNTYKKPLDIIWKSQNDTIEDLWDCFEILRVICLKEKRFPWLGLPSDLNYDTLSITKLKALRCISKISETVFLIIPTIKNYDIKPFILIHYLLQIRLIIERMTRLLKQMKTKELTVFQMRSLFIQNIFLKEMVVKNILPKSNVGKSFIESMISVMEIANELEYPEPTICALCGDKVLGPTCMPPHGDSRCCFTMMPIFIVPEYKCPYCKVVAHKAVEEEMSLVICPFCDKIMDKLYVSNESLKENCDKYEASLPALKQSDCYEDCCDKSLEYEDIEDNSIEYVILSDSDEDTENIKTLYEKFSKFSISDVKKTLLEES